MIITLRSLPALTLAALATTSTVSAIDAGGIAIHGSLSATGAYSDKYDYYGDTSGSFDLIAQELTLNGTYRFENGLRAAAQVYAYDLAGYSALTIDLASLDYSFNEYVGLRLGRNKLPQGMYSEVQDLDQIRTLASLPLNVYPRALRAMSAGYNGAGLYGNVALGNAGGLEYQVFFGWLNNIKGETPFAKGRAALVDTDALDLDQIYGGMLVWNAPLEGLKFAYTYNYIPGALILGHVQTRAGLLAIGSPTVSVAAMIDANFGAGTWDNSGLFAGSRSSTEIDVTIQLFSAEYTHDKWVFAAEYKKQENVGTTNLLASPPLRISNSPVSASDDHWYVQASYQATDKLGLGFYYAQSDFDPDNTNTADEKFTSVNDLSIGASYALTANWLIKVEGHAMDGLGSLGVAGDRNLGATDPKWTYFVVKTTFSF